MTSLDAVLIVLAGLGAGAINTVVGAGTLITFPTLVALGLPPVTSTMSDVIGLTAGKVSGSWGYRNELRGQWNRLRWQIPAAVIGAALGALLLLRLPEDTFTGVAPVVLVAALVLVLLGPRIQGWARRRATDTGRSTDDVSAGKITALTASTFLIAIAGGYFPAALGILLIGAMGAIVPESMQRINGAKNVLTLLINVVAALAYVVVAFDRISWPVAGLIAIGSLVGGWLGAHYGRRLSPNALRGIVVVVGIIGLYRLLTI